MAGESDSIQEYERRRQRRDERGRKTDENRCDRASLRGRRRDVVDTRLLRLDLVLLDAVSRSARAWEVVQQLEDEKRASAGGPFHSHRTA